VGRNVQVMEFGAVVVANQPRLLLVVLRLELYRRRSAVAMRLLPPREGGLSKHAARRLAPEQAQVAGPRVQAEQLVRPRRAQPLKLDGQRRVVAVFARWRRRKRLGRQLRRGSFALWKGIAVLRVQPVVRAPRHALNGRLAT